MHTCINYFIFILFIVNGIHVCRNLWIWFMVDCWNLYVVFPVFFTCLNYLLNLIMAQQGVWAMTNFRFNLIFTDNNGGFVLNLKTKLKYHSLPTFASQILPSCCCNHYIGIKWKTVPLFLSPQYMYWHWDKPAQYSVHVLSSLLL